MNKTGWTQLKIETNPAFDDDIMMHAAGYLEGALSQHEIFQYSQSYFDSEFHGSKPPKELTDFIHENDAWTRQQSKANPNDPFWRHVQLVLVQLDGLIAGYQATAPKNEYLSYSDIVIINLTGDLGVLLDALVPGHAPDWHHMSAEDVTIAKMDREHCSSLVKVTDTFSDVFAAHTTWEAIKQCYVR